MARKRTKPEVWNAFEERISEKRMNGSAKKSHNVPTDIMVQRMSATASGRLKKFEPLDTRDYVPFSEYTELSVVNIKKACEKFYKMPENSCDILASDRGPSCSRFDQIKTKKVYHIRFLEESFDDRSSSFPMPPVMLEPLSVSLTQDTTPQRPQRPHASIFAKSVSIADLLKAGKLVKKVIPDKLVLESFNLDIMQWEVLSTVEFQIEKEKFASGAFREAFKAVVNDKNGYSRNWVVKKYTQKSIDGMQELNMTHEEHTRKQVQMHTVARNIAQRFAKNTPKEFGCTFEYGKVFYSQYKDLPVTVEEFVEGDFYKYINNDGECGSSTLDDLKIVFLKAQTLVHYSYLLSEKRFMLLDIQGSMYKLYDPEIATNDLTDNDELYFCSGNLSVLAIGAFRKEHTCNCYCRMMKLEKITDSETVHSADENKA